MYKKLTILLLCVLLFPCFLLPVSSQTIDYISDHGGLLFTEEIAALEEKAADIASAYNIAPVILTVDSLDGKSAQDYADDYYDNNGYQEDGVLFLLAMTEREWYISTSGMVIYALTDYGIQEIGEGILPYLADGCWFDGFYYFLAQLPYYLDAYENGIPVDGYADYSGDFYHGEQEEVLYYEEDSSPNLFYSLFAGFITAGISVFVMRSSMNTKRAQRNACAYMQEGSWNLYQHRDLFLYSNVTKTRRQENKPTHNGGSSVHRSSSGRRHGGGGGKF